MIQFYKPNNKVTGHAFSLKLVGNAFIFTLLKQANTSTDKKGNFAPNRKQPGKEINVKINLTEACSILSSIKTNSRFSTVHDNKPKNKTVGILFEPYFRGAPDAQEQVGYSFRVNETSKDPNGIKASYIIGFTFGEAELLSQAIIVGVRKVLFAEQARQDSYAGNRQAGNQSAPQVPNPEPPQVPDLTQEPDFTPSENDSPVADDTF